MIKKLINDIAFDTIRLSQGLTRAKLIGNKIRNDTFREWLDKELEGYKYEDIYLPLYRKISSIIMLTAEFPYDRVEKFPVSISGNLGKELNEIINIHQIIEPISIVEQQIEALKTPRGYIKLSPQQVEIIAKPYSDRIASYGGVIRFGEREVGRVQYQNVLEQTKQKLLDTLMQLDNEFPDLIDEYTMNTTNNEKVNNIITNNIYGDNNPMNIATGVSVELNVVPSKITLEDENNLKSLGVNELQVEEIKNIVNQNSDDKQVLTSKAMKWLGSVTASVAGRGFYENLPQIIDFVQKITT